MASPWSLLQYDEDGNIINPFDDAQRSPAGESAKYQPPAEVLQADRDSLNGQVPYDADMAQAMGMAPVTNIGPLSNGSEYAQQFQRPQPRPAAPNSQLGGMAEEITQMPGFGMRGMSLEDQQKLENEQKLDNKNVIFQTPTRARLNSEMSMGMYARQLRDSNGLPVSDKDGNPIYDPDNYDTDPNHPYQQQLAALQSARQLMGMRLKYAPNQVDLRPLLSWIDANSNPGQNPHLAENYTPHTFEQSSAQLAAGQNGLIKDQNDLYKTAAQSAEHLQAGQQSAMNQILMNKALSAGWGQGRQNMEVDPMVRQYDMWQRTDPVKGYNSARSALDNLALMRQEIAQGNPIDDARFPVMRASVDAHGRPNIAEVSIEGGDPAAVARYEQALTKYATGRMSPHNRQLALQSVDNIAGMMQSEMQREERLGRGTAQNYGVDQPRVDRTFGYQLPPGVKPGATGDAQSQSQGPSMQEMFDQWKAQKGQQ